MRGMLRSSVRPISAAAAGARWLVTRKPVWFAGAAAALAGLLMLALHVLPQLWVGPTGKDLSRMDRLKAINDIRSTLVTALGGGLVFTGALVGAFFTARTIQVSREGQITDRFTRAIDQLGQPGDDRLDVRLGGIYALERIARESATDHGPIMEVLTAFPREHARGTPDNLAPGPRSVPKPAEQSQILLPASVDADSLKTQPPASDVDLPLRPRADFQAIATVLGRRPEERRRQEQAPLDLREVYLRLVDLIGAHLAGANLSGAHLEWASLVGTHLEGADLTGAHLEGTRLVGAHLEGADLT